MPDPDLPFSSSYFNFWVSSSSSRSRLPRLSILALNTARLLSFSACFSQKPRLNGLSLSSGMFGNDDDNGKFSIVVDANSCTDL